MADRQVDRIWSNVALLARQPYAGRLVDEFGQNVRVISAKKYQIDYEVRADVVWVDPVVAGEREQRRAVLGGEE